MKAKINECELSRALLRDNIKASKTTIHFCLTRPYAHVHTFYREL